MSKYILSLIVLLFPALAFAETGAVASTGAIAPLPTVSCESVYQIV